MARDSFNEQKNKNVYGTRKKKKDEEKRSQPSSVTNVNKKAQNSTFMGGGSSVKKTEQNASRTTPTRKQTSTPSRSTSMTDAQYQKTYGQPRSTGSRNTTVKRQPVGRTNSSRLTAAQQQKMGLNERENTADRIRARMEKINGGSQKDADRRSVAQAQKSGDYQRVQELRGKAKPGSLRDKYERWDKDIADTITHTVKQGLAADARVVNQSAKGITDKDAFLYTTEEQRKEADKKFQERESKLAKKVEEESQAIEDIQSKHGYIGRQALSAVSSTTGMGMDIAANAIVPGTGLAHMWSRSTGTSMGQVNKKAASLRNQLESTGQYSKEELDEMFKNTDALDMANAAASGGVEVLSELLFPGIGAARKVIGGKGMSIAERVGAKLFNKAGAKASTGILKNITKGTVEEIAEEEIGGPVQAWVANVLYGNRFQGYNEDAIKRTLMDESNALRGNITSEEDARAVAARLNSQDFMDESVKMYMDSGNTKKEAEELAELSKEYLTASLTGDVDAMKDAQDKMVKILAGGENSMKEKFTLQDAIDAAVSTAMMTTVTGAPAAMSTMQIGNSYKENVGLDAVKQQAEMIRNWSDGKEASQAQAIIDHIDDGGDVSGTQVYDIIQQAGEVAAENKESEDAKNRLAQTEMNKRDLRISPVNEDGTLGPQTEQRYEQIFSSTVSRYDTLTKIGESAGFEREDIEVGADAGAAFETGVISSEQINELARGSAAVKTVFEDVTGIDISQFDSYSEMRDALMAQAADNMVNSARLEQAAWNDEARGAMAQSISKGIGASGNEAVLKAFMGIDPRDRGKFLLTGEAASRVYDYAKHTEDDWNEVKHTFKDMFKGTDEAALKAVFDAAKEDKLIEETEYWGKAVKSGEKLSQHSAEQVQVPGEVINKENIPLGAEDQLFLQTWAKAFHVNYDLVSTLPVKVKNAAGEIVEGQAEGSFRPSTNTLTINVNEGVMKPVRKTIQHELSHSAIYAPDDMLNLLKYIRDAWYKNDPEGYSNAIKEVQARYSGEQQLSELKALEELMADGAADFDFWNDADLAERMANENPSLAQKVLNVIRDVLRKIRSILASGNIRNKEYSDAVFAYAVDMSKAEELYIRAINAAKNAKADMAIDEWQDEANGNVATEMEDSFSIVQDPKLIQELEADEHRTTYRAMALIDGKLYPPMASKIQDESGNWNLQQGLELGQWVESDATTDSRMFNAKGQFHLMKDNGDDLWVAYNPYIHSSDSMMNDQFSTYHKRPNLVVVEGEIPESEVTSGYRAETTLDDGRRILAKDTTGPTQKWNTGDVFKELKKRYGRKRTVYLTNHFKPTRIVPDSEVAQHINGLVADTDVAVPYNVVPPGVRRELQNLGTNMEQNKQAKYYVDLNEDTSYSIPASNELLAARDDTAIFINNTAGANYIDMIFNGEKTEETRTRRTLDSFIGKEVAVTDGKQVYGTIVLGEPHKYKAEEFRSEEAQAKHRVPVGDKYDSENGKWAYPIESYNRYSEPLTLTDDKNYLGSRQARQVVTEDRSNWSKGVFPLTGKPVSQEYKDAVEYLENGGILGEGGFDAAWYNSLSEVKEARSRIGDAEETIKDKSPERIKLREGWVQDLMNYGSARDAFVDGKRTTVYDGIVRQDRRIDLIVGLPSSGKSSALVDPISFKYKSRLLDSDEAKKLIPEFDDGWGAGRVHEESSQLLTDAFVMSLENGDNIVMPILGKSVNSIEKRVKAARQFGYEVYVRMCDLPANKAAARNLIRFINTGRFVDLEQTSLAALNGPAESFDAVVKKGEIDGYTEVSNDVKRGQNPKFVRGEKDISYNWRDSGQGREGVLGEVRSTDEGEASGQSDEVRYSLSSISEAAGLTFSKRDGRTILTDRNGKEISEVTPAYLKKTPIGRLLTLSESDAYNVMSDAAVDNRLKFLSDLFNMIIDTQDIDLIWAVSGTLGYDPMHLVDENTPQNKIKEQKSKFASITGNSDPQYKSTIDFTTICVKTQAIIDAMSALMKKLNRGLSEHEIIDIVYNETHLAGEQVPCPVCYVFSRWVGLGNLFSKIQEFQKRYPEGTDMSLIAEEYDTLQAEVGEMASSLGIRGGKARDILYRQTLERKNELDELVYYDRASDEEKQELEVIDRRLDVLDHWSWLGKTRLDPNYKEVPADVLFDINAGREFATKYPAVWKFRTTRGPSLGKAAAPYTPSRLGDTIRGIASPGALKDIGMGARPFLAKTTTKTAKKYFDKAVMNAKRQNRMNGQRLQSTSDFRFEYGLDYILSFIELEAIGAKAQMYTKVPEAVKFLASTQAEVNCSIMPLGRGVDENGNLVFSDVTGMSWADALALSKAYDNVQPILVAIGPDHLTAAMADSDITMIIPYHASGSSEGRYISMMQTVGESVEDRTDFAEYESEHETEDATPEQVLARNLRIDILTGKKEILKPAEKQVLENNEILRQLYIRIYGMDENGNEAKPDSKYVENYDENGNDADCYGVYLTKDQAKVMMPYEYWDKTSTIKDADKQGKAYQEYCKSLGITPVFSGWDSKGKYHEDMDFSDKPGYWKTLIDRCMYNNDGTYHKQNAINLDNVDLDMLDSEMMREEVVKPLQVNDPAKTEEIVNNALKRIEAEQVSFSISAKYDADYMEAVEADDMDKAQELVDKAAAESGMRVAHRYHGTMNAGFTVFDKAYAKVGGNSGAGFYFSTEEDDSINHYQDVEGADNYFKWSSLAEHINQQIEDGEWEGPELETYEDVEEYAKNQLNASPGTYDVYLNYKNPYIRDYKNSTNIYDALMDDFDESVINREDYEDEWEYEDALWEAKEEHLSEALYGAVYGAYQDLENNYEVIDIPYIDDVLSKIAEYAFDGSLTWEDIESGITFAGEVEVTNPEWTDSGYAVPELTRAIIENLGFDAIEDKEVSQKFGQLSREMMTDTEHIIVFKPEQIKLSDPVTYAEDGSVIPLSERFDPNNDDIRYSLPTQDSDGNILTDGQMEYFKNSQARDILGRLVPVYHTTNYGGFTIFDPSFSDDKRSLFFASNWNVSQTYGRHANKPIEFLTDEEQMLVDEFPFIAGNELTGKANRQAGYYSCYLNLENPLIVDARGHNWNDIPYSTFSRSFDEYEKELQEKYNTAVSSVKVIQDQYDDEFSLPTMMWIEVNFLRKNSEGEWIEDLFADQININLEDYIGEDGEADPYETTDALWDAAELSLINAGLPESYVKRLEKDAIDFEGDINHEVPDWDYINSENDTYDMTSDFEESDSSTYRTRELAEMAEAQGYDGVIIRDCVDIGGTSKLKIGASSMSDIYIAFSSNQVKDIHNENPSENPDIRYSIVDDDEAMSYAAHSDAYDNSYEALAYYEDLIAADASEETTYRKAKKFIEKDVDEFFAGLESYADGMRFEDPVLEEGRTRMARSKADFFNSNIAEWNESWKTEGEILSADSIRKPVRDLVMAAMNNSDTDRKYKADLVNKTIVDVRLAYYYARQGRTDIAHALLWHTALRMVENVEFIKDETFKQYKDLRDYLRTTRISLSEEYWSDVDYQAFRKENFGRLKLVNGDTNVDEIYQELNERWPEWFSEDEDMTPPDQLLQIGHVLDVIQPYKEAYTSEEAAYMTSSIADNLYTIMEGGKPFESLADQLDSKGRKQLGKLYEGMEQAEQRYQADMADLKAAFDEQTKAMKQRHEEAVRNVETEMANMEEAKNAEIEELKRKAAIDFHYNKYVIAKERAEKWRLLAEKDEKFKEYKAQQKEKQEHRKWFNRITKAHKKLTERLLSNTADKNIPEQYKKEVAKLLAAFDLQTVGSKKVEERRGIPARKTIEMAALKAALNSIENRSGEFHVSDAITDIMDALLGEDVGSGNNRSIEGLTIDELNSSELERIAKLLEALLHEFNTYKSVKVQAKRRQTADIGHAQNNISLEHAEMFGPGRDYQNTPGWIDKILNLDEMTAAYLFKRIDPNKEGLGLMYGEIRKSFDKYVRNQRQLNDWMEEIVGKYHSKGILWNKYGSGELTNWRSDNYAQNFTLESGHTIRLTVAQMMSVACLANREQAYNHMTGNGVVVAPVTFQAKMLSDLKKKVNKALPEKLTPSDIKAIVTALTPEQRQVANKLQELMATKMAEWGNEASMNVLGIRLFEDPNYFPIRSDRGGLTKDLDPNQFEQAIRNFGFTKAVRPGAKNAIMIDDIFDVVTEHCNNMNLYNSYTEAMNDFMKVYNYREARSEGEYTVEQALNHAFSAKAPMFIMQFMRDLNGNVSRRASGIEDAYNSLLANSKKAAVFANLRVAAQQPTAITRAFAAINPKYLKGIRIGQGDMKEMFEHCPIALWKSWGFYDINMGKSIEDIMMNNGRWLEDAATELYGYLDNVTWTAIWQMVKAEMKDTHPEVKPGTDEYWELCNERMSEVVDLTQVVDSPMHRSHAMRDKGFLKKTATAFMAEPTLTFNMIRDGWISAKEAKKRGDKAEAERIRWRTIGVALLQAATVSGMAALVDALRKKKPDKDDDDDRFLHLWWVNALENFEDELKLWNKVYFVKDIASIFEGWDNANLALQGFQKFALGYRQLTGDPYARSSAEWYENMADGIGYMWGVPIKTIRTGLANAMNATGISSPLLEQVGEGLSSIKKDPKADENGILGMLSSLLSDGTSTSGMFGKLLAIEPKSIEAEPEEGESSMTKDDLPDNLTDEQKNDIIKSAERRSKKATPAEEQQQLDYDDMLYKALKAASGLEGEEYNKKVYSSVANGLKGYIADGDYMSIGMMRTVIEQAGGDVDYFDQRVLDETKSAYKKVLSYDQTLEERSNMKAMYRYMMGHGMTQEQLSADILYSSDLAKDMKVAYRLGDNELIYEAMLPLVDAGIMKTDLDRLYENRNKMDLAKYKQNGRFKDKLKSMGTFIWPTEGVITSHFGYRGYVGPGASRNHPAIDIGAPAGTPVSASDGGTVIYAGWNGGYGNSVGVKHDNGMVTYYNHLSAWNVKVGDTVAQGQQIANVGNTGTSYGAHLDFKILDKNGKPVDPEKYLDKRS